MKLTATVKLLTTPAQAAALRETLAAENAACDAVSAVAWSTSTFQQFALQAATYYDVRRRFGLSADTTVRVIAKVADAYTTVRAQQRERDKEQADKKQAKPSKTKRAAKPKKAKKPKRGLPRCTFSPDAAFPYNERILRWHMDAGTVSIWTMQGRLTIPFAAGKRQRWQLQSQHGETDLMVRHGSFYLAATCDVAEAPPIVPGDVLGVDLGIANIAADSDGTLYSGAHVDAVRAKHRTLRGRLQRAGTRSAKRHLQRPSGRERRFATDVNHVISKQLVERAEGTGRAIALENLKGIRNRTTVRRSQRARHHSWAFFQLRTFVEYKAQARGVPVVLVDPRNSSRECSRCGHIDKRNRPTQATFKCRACGHTAHADLNSATNLRARGRAVVNRPIVALMAPPSDGPTAPDARTEQRQAAGL